jgi:cysteine desulfurase
VDLDSLATNIAADTAVVSVMSANNETGVVQPLEGIASVVNASLGKTALTHTDAVAAAPWLDLTDVTSSIDMISICAHKIGGPVNSGALILRGDVALDAMVPGGGQERGRRGGTVDVASAVGLATAVRLTAKEREEVTQRVTGFQRQLLLALTHLEGCLATAPGATRLPGTVHLTFAGLASDELIFLLDQEGVCAAAASSCSSGAAVASHVLAAMGMAPERARGSLRLSMGAETTQADVDALIVILSSVVDRLYPER